MSDKKIKRRNGEEFLKTIRNYDNGILDIPDIDKVLRFAGHGKHDAEQLLTYLSSLKGVKIKEEPAVEDPFVLLKKAGYDAFYADTLEKQNSIKHLYAGGEAICTFNDSSRFKNYYIVHCVHENAAKLERSSFSNPRREDDYGTSVISIQMAKKGGFISIKNRYNHSVNNCDNTFNSNPDNIIKGLSAALKHYFKVNFASQKSPLPDGGVLCGKQVCKQEQEVSGIVFGADFYIENGQLTEVLAGDGQYLLNNYIYDDKTKTMSIVSKTIIDSFPDDFNEYYGGKKSLSWRGKSLYDGDLEIIRCK